MSGNLAVKNLAGPLAAERGIVANANTWTPHRRAASGKNLPTTS